MHQRSLVAAVLLLSSARFSAPIAARARREEEISATEPSAAPLVESIDAAPSSPAAEIVPPQADGTVTMTL